MSHWLARRFVGSLVAVGLLGVSDRVAAQADIPVSELAPHFKGGKHGHAYTNAMLELGMRMGAATTAALREDRAQATSAIKAFRDQMNKVGAMVPAWKAQFRPAAIDELESAVNAKADVAARRKIVTKIEKSCTACHARYMFPVQARFRWGEFANASVSLDAGGTLSFHQVMLDLANGLGAVRGDVEAGQLKEAQAAYRVLMERFGLMEQLCANCHDQPRQYFIDSNVKGRLYKIGGMLRRGETQVAEYTPLFREINESSCLPCHQVHMPAAFLQESLKDAGK